MPLGYNDELGKLIYDMKLNDSANEPIAREIERIFGERPKDYRRIREWHTTYTNRNNTDNSVALNVYNDISYDDIQGIFERTIYAILTHCKRPLSIGIISDVHLPDENPNAMRLAMQLVNIAQPDLIVWNGDLFDFSAESRYPSSHKKMSEDSFSLALQRYDNYHRILNYKPSYELMTCGNHDIRWNDCLQSMSASVRNAALRDFTHQLKQRELYFGGWDVAQIYYKNQILIQHGDSIGVNTARNNLLKAGYGFHVSWFGHAHKHQDSVQTSLAGEFASISSAAIQNKSPEWSKSTAPNNFQYGCGFVTLLGQDTMPIWENVKFAENGKKMSCLFGGKIVEVG